VSRETQPRDPAGRRRFRRRGPSLLSALLGAGLLIVLGFALGIVAGLMLEEPQLLLDYVTGKTHSVALVAGPQEPGETGALPHASPPDVAARGPSEPTAAASPRAPAPPAGEPVGARAPRPAGPGSDGISAPVPPVAAPPPAGPEASTTVPPGRSFSVQVGAFADAAPAEQLARRLKGQGLPVYVAPGTGSDARKWRVRVGPLADRAEAERLAERLEKRDKLPTWVLAEGAP
jgi:cell division septation protein DedD